MAKFAWLPRITFLATTTVGGGLLFAQLDQLGQQIGRMGQNRNSTVKRLEFNVESPKIRPLESTVVQIKVYGEVPIKDSTETRSGRLQEGGWTLALNPANDGGWLSKPFKYQGKDTEGFVSDAGGLVGSIFRSATNQFTLKDSVVYHAPPRPGRYKIIATLGSITAETEIEVDASAPSSYTPQQHTFGPEPTSIVDPYRRLAEFYAPYIAQETWFQWTADALCRSDYDNDWDAGNNWNNLGKGSTQAYVYYAAIESQTHWFLIYNFFHARDYSDNCVAGTCHENDNEGMILTIRKDSSEFGKLEAMETLAHNNVYSYVNDSSIRKGAHDIEANVAFHNGSHPIVFLEAGGHGALGAADKKSFFDPSRMAWKQNTGITYVYKGVAERPKHAMDREVGYELLPIYHHWWARASRETAGKFMSAFYRYQPFGNNRPGMRLSEVAGSFAGGEHGKDKAKPFWGWHDTATQRRKILATGQWATDPAYAITQNLTFPANKPVSLDYVFNPYLNTPEIPFVEIVRNIQSGEVAPPASIQAITTPQPQQQQQAQQQPQQPQPAGASPAGAVSAVAAAVAIAASGSPAVNSGSCEVEVRVDGTVFLQVEGTVARFEVVNGAPPEERATNCTASVPAFGAKFQVEKRSGRGTVKLVDPQTGRVEISDPSRGAADYKLTLRWSPGN
jgi:hypothetical protein